MAERVGMLILANSCFAIWQASCIFVLNAGYSSILPHP